MATSCDKQINIIYQGSTPIFHFNVCLDTSLVDKGSTHIMFTSGTATVDKFGDDITLGENFMECKLNQDDTMSFNGNIIVVQILTTLNNGQKVPSVKRQIPTDSVLGGRAW